HPALPSFPTRRSSDLLVSHDAVNGRILTTVQIRTRAAKRALAVRGMMEAVTWSFIPARHAELFGGGQPALKLANPIAADMSDMRDRKSTRLNSSHVKT